jgi:predicted CXXCH cytochrome family protein
MKWLLIARISICTFTCLLLLTERLEADTITVLSPANNSYVENDQINIVFSLPNSDAATVNVLAGGKVFTKKVEKRSGNSMICLGVTLVNGLNIMEINVSGNSSIINKSSLTVYLRSGLSKPHQKPPTGFQRYYFHLPANEAACTSCHRMEASLHDLNPERREDSPCYQCHKNKGNSAYKHMPVAAGKCFSCHEVSKDRRKYITRKPDQTTCFVCHSTQNKIWKAKKVHHGPTAVGNCTLCHNPHGSNWPSFTHMHPTDLCINCHSDKKSGLHVIAGFFAKGHPVKTASNPLKPDRPFSCAGCHNPHAGDTQSLLNKERSSNNTYCQTCHKL